MKRIMYACIFVVCSAVVNTQAETVHIRGESNGIHGTVLSGGINGLRFREHSSADVILIPWSTVTEIESTNNPSRFDTFIAQGTQLWRARQRLVRGDIQLAEPLFERLFSHYLGLNCTDASLVSEGLLRCLVSRGALEKAVHPWLETMRHHELGTRTQFSTLAPIIDESTMLCPHLPLVWLDNPLLIEICETYKTSPQKITGSIATVIATKGTNSPGEQIDGLEDGKFLIEILGSSKGRANDIKLLLDREQDLPPWKRAWAHYFMATGYFSEQNPKARVKGMLQLARVAATSTRITPWLAGASMIRLAEELKKDGMEQESKRINAEAQRLFPTHPKLSHGKKEQVQ